MPNIVQMHRIDVFIASISSDINEFCFVVWKYLWLCLWWRETCESHIKQWFLLLISVCMQHTLCHQEPRIERSYLSHSRMHTRLDNPTRAVLGSGSIAGCCVSTRKWEFTLKAHLPCGCRLFGKYPLKKRFSHVFLFLLRWCQHDENLCVCAGYCFLSPC